MLRREDDMKEWQREIKKDEHIIGIVSPQGISTDDLIDVPDEAIEEEKPKKVAQKKAPVKKAPVKKTTAKKTVEKMEVEG